MVSWGKRNGLKPQLLESYTQKGGHWQDFVGVFVKDGLYESKFPERILDIKKDFENGLLRNNTEFLNPSEVCQDEKKLVAIGQILSEQIVIN
jgi:hypothetical protein